MEKAERWALKAPSCPSLLNPNHPSIQTIADANRRFLQVLLPCLVLGLNRACATRGASEVTKEGDDVTQCILSHTQSG